jgi:hypothetical protein
MHDLLPTNDRLAAIHLTDTTNLIDILRNFATAPKHDNSVKASQLNQTNYSQVGGVE